MSADNGGRTARRARVLLLTLLFAPDGVSTAHLLSDLVRQLRGLGHEILVVTTTPHYNVDPDARAAQPLVRSRIPFLFRSTFGEVPVWHVRMRQKGTRVLGRAIDYLVFHLLSTALAWKLRADYDVILVPSPPLTAGLAAAVLARLTRRPLVYNVQEIYPDIAVELGVIRDPVVLAASRWVERFVYRQSDVVVTISKRFRDRLLAKGVPAEKVDVISNFAPDALAAASPPRRNAFSTAHGLDDAFVVLYAGNLGLTQDFDMVLEAAAELDSATAVRFVIAGDGARRSWLQSQLASRRTRNVLLMPYQPSSVVGEMYASSDVGLIPMRLGVSATTFPSKIYTIMASARPVIAAVESDSDVADLIRAAECGWVVAPGSGPDLARAVLFAYGDRAAARAMGEAGRRYVHRHHTSAVVAGQYAETFASLLTR